MVFGSDNFQLSFICVRIFDFEVRSNSKSWSIDVRIDPLFWFLKAWMRQEKGGRFVVWCNHLIRGSIKFSPLPRQSRMSHAILICGVFGLNYRQLRTPLPASSNRRPHRQSIQNTGCRLSRANGYGFKNHITQQIRSENSPQNASD